MDFLLGVVALRLDSLDHLVRADLAALDPLAQLQHVLGRHRTRQHAVGHDALTLLDLLGDLHLPVPAEERHVAHLAQVHAHRVAGLAGDVRLRVVLGLAVLGLVGGAVLRLRAQRHPLIGVHHLDVHLAEDGHDVVELLR